MLIDKEVKLSLPVLQNVLQPLEDWRRPVLDLSQNSLKDDHIDQALGIFQAVDLLSNQSRHNHYSINETTNCKALKCD